MNKRYLSLLIVLLFLSVITGNTFGQEKGKRRAAKAETVTVNAVIKDANGKPVSNVLVSGKEGAIEVLSGADGQFSITVPKVPTCSLKQMVTKQRTFLWRKQFLLLLI
jgi:hypothetical protein